MTNIMTFKYRKICELLPEGDYPATITDVFNYSKGNDCSMVVTFEICGGDNNNLKLKAWFHDSSEEGKIKERKEFFESLGHAEWFDLEQLDTNQLLKLKLKVRLNQYTKKKGEDVGKVVNSIEKYMPIGEQSNFVEPKLNDGIPF